mgnify:CR=1 FL=1|tara:strand:- start:242 stop:520 length:279 start_codon:yes stop_codon:yes gene_type:complete
MAYKNDKGENLYLFGWLKAEAGSKHFEPTTGGNSVWAKNKRQAISKVNAIQKEHEKEYPNRIKLRVDPESCIRSKTYNQARDFDRALYLMTV